MADIADDFDSWMAGFVRSSSNVWCVSYTHDQHVRHAVQSAAKRTYLQEWVGSREKIH